MSKTLTDLREGLRAFPAFPVVLVTVGDNIITVGMVHVFSFRPPLVGIGIAPARYSFALLREKGEFVVNIPTPRPPIGHLLLRRTVGKGP